MPTTWILLLPPTLALGWFGTRTAVGIHRTRGSRSDVLFMLLLAWGPLLAWLLSLLLSFIERNP